MKFKKILATGLMGIGFALGINFAGMQVADAYQVDESSPVYLGFDGKTWNYCAVIIYEDNGEANTYYYKFEYPSDFMLFKVNADGEWNFIDRNSKAIAGYRACYNKLHQKYKRAKVII